MTDRWFEFNLAAELEDNELPPATRQLVEQYLDTPTARIALHRARAYQDFRKYLERGLSVTMATELVGDEHHYSESGIRRIREDFA